MTIRETIPIVDNVHPMYVMILSAFCIGFDWSTKEYVLIITGQYICSEYVYTGYSSSSIANKNQKKFTVTIQRPAIPDILATGCIYELYVRHVV